MRLNLYFLLFFLIIPLHAESFVDGESFANGESIVSGESINDGDSFVGGESFTKGESFGEGESITDGKGEKIGVFESVVENVYSNTYSSTTQNIYDNVYEDAYVNGYGKYLEIVAEYGIDAQANFVHYFSDWQWYGHNEDFYSYSASRAEQEMQLAQCYDKAVKKFGIGTALVATTWIVSFAVPGGTIYQVAIITIAKTTTVDALSGGVIGAIFSAGRAYLQGKSGDELIQATVSGAADGYLVGAITGVARGSLKVAKMMKDAKKLKNLSGTETIFDGKVFDESGKLIGKYDPNWYTIEKDVRDAEKKGLESLSILEKGNYGEMKADLFMRSNGYSRISKNKVTNLVDKGPTGIDGDYYNPNGKPPYVIAEAKCGYQAANGSFIGKNALSSPADGIEMSGNWLNGKITGNNRLVEAVGKKVADDIELAGYEKVLIHTNSNTGACSAYLLDDLANDVNIIGTW